MKRLILALAATTAIYAAPASATTFDLSQFQRNDGGASFWTGSEIFALPTGATGVTLNITGFAADDRAVLKLNGNVIDSTGIFGPGLGSFVFTSGGSNDPYTFITGGRPEQAFQPQNINITSGFLTGANTLSFIINDTGAGISGGLTNGPAGPTAYNFAGSVSFSQAVPEPATWALMLLGFGVIGFAMRKRSIVRTTVTYA